jgi:hypothetical protein
MPLNRALIKKALGSVEDETVADILATGASAEKLAQARAWTANEEARLNTGSPLPSGRVAHLVELLMDLDELEE